MTVLWDGQQTCRANIRRVYLVTLGVKWDWALIRFAGAVSSCRLIRPALQVTANPHQRIFFSSSFFRPCPELCYRILPVIPGLRWHRYGCVRKRWRLFEFFPLSRSRCACSGVEPPLSPCRRMLRLCVWLGVVAALCWRHLCVNFSSAGRLHKTQLLIPALPADFY